MNTLPCFKRTCNNEVVEGEYGVLPFYCNDCQKEMKEDVERDKAIDKSLADPKIKCPECGARMLIRFGPIGAFYGCSKYPSCRGTKDKDPKTSTMKGLAPSFGKGGGYYVKE